MKPGSPTLFFLGLLLSHTISSQTGPAGVGATSSNALWLKADAGTNTSVNGAAVNSWSDQSGNGNNVSQSTANLQPLYGTNVMNGFPSILFDNISNTNDKLTGADSPTLDNTAGYTFFTVSRPLNLDGNARVLLSKRTTVSVDQSFMLFYYTGNKLHSDVQTVNDRFASNTVYANNNNYLIDLVYDGSLAAASRCKLYNGESLDITASESSASIPNNASPLIIGSTDATDPRPYGGYISEIIMYRTALTDAPRIIVNNYLSAKYNIALTANDKYAGDNAGNGNYDREVAGVGKESTGANNSFSASVSGGITIDALSGLDNGDYILAGHAFSVNAQISTDVGGMTGTMNARWQRIWYVDITNSSTNITTDIEFDLSDGGTPGTPGPTANYVLLYRAGQTGNWTEIAVASSTPGDRIKFNNIILTNDGYYTVGTKNYDASPLPIQLVDFEVKKLNKQVQVKWKTASEKDVKEFSIQRSADALNYDELETVQPKGNGTYVVQDKQPLKGLSYYRLKVLDKSGEISYPGLDAVNFDESENENYSFELYPNPAHDGDVTIKLSNLSACTFQIYDLIGRECYSEKLLPDDHAIHRNFKNILSEGSYIFCVRTETKTAYKKLVISE